MLIKISQHANLYMQNAVHDSHHRLMLGVAFTREGKANRKHIKSSLFFRFCNILSSFFAAAAFYASSAENISFFRNLRFFSPYLFFGTGRVIF